MRPCKQPPTSQKTLPQFVQHPSPLPTQKNTGHTFRVQPANSHLKLAHATCPLLRPCSLDAPLRSFIDSGPSLRSHLSSQLIGKPIQDEAQPRLQILIFDGKTNLNPPTKYST